MTTINLQQQIEFIKGWIDAYEDDAKIIEQNDSVDESPESRALMAAQLRAENVILEGILKNLESIATKYTSIEVRKEPHHG